MSLFRKFLIIIGVVIACTIIGVVGIALLMFFSGVGIDALKNGDLSALLENKEYGLMKISLLINHITSFILSALVLAWIFDKTNFKKYAGLSNNIDVILLLKLLGLMLLVYPIAGLSAALVGQLDMPDWMIGLDDQNVSVLTDLLKMDSPFDLLINLLVIAIIPGIGEEMLFRGVIQNELQKHLSHKYLPLMITAFIFAAFHLEPTGLLAKFFIGCILGYAFYITKNILYPMIIHGLNNGFQVLIVYFTGIDKSMDRVIPPADTMQILGALATLPLIYLLIKNINQDNNGFSIKD